MWRWRLLALVLGAPAALIFPEANLWWLGYVALVPLLLLVAASPNRREAIWRSWLAGAGFFLALHHWLLPVLGPFVPFAVLAMATTWIPPGLAAWWTVGRSESPSRVLVALAVVPSVWVLTEVFRSWDVLGGSWGFLGLSQWNVPPVLAIAALGGVWALSWVLVAFNVGVALALRRSTPAPVRILAVAVPGALLGAGVLWGELRPSAPEHGTVRIAGVQPGVVDDGEERLRANEDLTAEIEVERDGVELIVWGQSSVAFDPEVEDEVRERLESLADEAGVDVLVNVDARRPDGRIAKSSALFRPGVGMDDTYDKQRLVPFGEYIPLRPVLGWISNFTDAAAEDRVPGGDLTLIESAQADLGLLISYESTFPDMRRAVARLGAEATVVQGASTTFQGSWAQPQQGSFEAVRAAESGRAALLVTVSGTSSAFDARGNRLAWIPSDETGTFLVDLPVGGEQTPYVRFGDWVPMLSLVVVLVASIAALVRRQKRVAQ